MSEDSKNSGIETRKCSNCGLLIRKREKFCATCGSRLDWGVEQKKALYCSQCGKRVIERGNYCVFCGNKVREVDSVKKEVVPNRLKVKTSSNKNVKTTSSWKPWIAIFARYGGGLVGIVGLSSLVANMILSDGEVHRMHWFGALTSYIPEGIGWVMLFCGFVLYVVGRSLDDDW